jgi:cephalosporin-C deacetylase
VQNLAARIRGKVQMTTGLMDETCPPSTQFAAYNKIVSHKEVFVYPDYEHEGFPGYDDRTYRFMMEMATQ